ncbi:hypothetical protein [Falsirhodobacter algicola]|uniref:Uncharacterized protein n=1 Tax=Falsirhodobacter algicola TaxID=2692330 RepID=A0A8J8SKY7_9RHOB|nr:hypothetical protein [Falsirhodobacter algicola]QUS35908.1 hypothetical protein GR316_06320 [Falsirhodobacter algicola]
MLRLLAAVICLGLGGPALADPPSGITGVDRTAPRTSPRTNAARGEDAAEIWLRESEPRR